MKTLYNMPATRAAQGKTVVESMNSETHKKDGIWLPSDVTAAIIVVQLGQILSSVCFT